MSGLFPISELQQAEPDLLKLPQKYSRPASDDQIERTKKSLEAKGHKVSVFNTSSEAVAFLKDHIPADSSVYNAGSTTLVSPLKIFSHNYSQSHISLERSWIPRCPQGWN